jgi:hypothetical protein
VDAVEFKVAWEASGDALCRFSTDELSRCNIPENAKRFLQSAGLPDEAAPFLSFQPIRLDWLGSKSKKFCGVGSDGAGNPFVIDADGTIWLIDHEAPERETFVNSSVETLAKSLLAYRGLVTETITTCDAEAFLDGRIPKQAIDTLSRSISLIDAVASESGTFWAAELSILRGEASD